MKNIIFHIGMYKTASTFFQKKILKQEISDYAFYIPGSILVEKILDYLNKPSNKKIKNIKNEINNIKKRNIIISHEGFFDHPVNEFKSNYSRLKLIENLVKKPKYIIFYREPSKLIWSSYGQGLKKKISIPFFEDYINVKFNKKNIRNFTSGFNYKIYNYETIFSEYLKIKNRVMFIDYDIFYSKDNSRLIDKLNQFTKIKLQYVKEHKKINTSYKYLYYLPYFYKIKIYKLIISLINFIFILPLNTKFLNHDLIYNKKNKFLNFLIFIFCLLNKNSIKLKLYEKNNLNILDYIKEYHSKSFSSFKKKVKYHRKSKILSFGS